ncbi:hypothetical protein BDW75DRAFT_226124 [Aspergillus navahoensis]
MEACPFCETPLPKTNRDRHFRACDYATETRQCPNCSEFVLVSQFLRHRRSCCTKGTKCRKCTRTISHGNMKRHLRACTGTTNRVTLNTPCPDLSTLIDSGTSQQAQERNIEVATETPSQVSYRLPQVTTRFPSHTMSPHRNATVLHSSPIPSVEAIKEAVVATFGSVFAELAHANVHHLLEVTSLVQSNWLSSTASVPKLLPSSRCWVKRVPTRTELLEDTIGLMTRSNMGENTESTFIVNCQGVVGKSEEAGLAFSQLLDPNPIYPVSILSLRLPILKELGFRCPVDLRSVIEPMEESHPRANLTPRFSFVDLHIGKYFRAHMNRQLIILRLRGRCGHSFTGKLPQNLVSVSPYAVKPRCDVGG